MLNNDILTLAETGQFDDATDEIESETVLYNQEQIKENDCEDDEIIEDDDYSFDEYKEYLRDKKDNHEAKCNNYNSWADKMDLVKIKTSSKANDKSDNATSDRVLDDRSMKIMYKMMRQNIFTTVKGNISAGKEANVYYAPTEDGQDFVVKVYMTSIMPFKARGKYMDGDFRFRNSNTSSSTKLVTTWAEKEFRNLMRISETNGAIPCPKPIKQKSMVLVMSMIGKLGEAAPKLKDLQLESDDEWSRLYRQLVGYVRILYQECRLIHADLSEYNLLYHENKIWMIDVSQSVEHFHPEALNFLRKDCHTMNTFFRNKGIKTVSLREFFDFVVDPSLGKHTDENFAALIDHLVDGSDYCENGEEDAFFLTCHIPRNLVDVMEYVKDFRKLRSDPNYIKNLPYAAVTGMTSQLENIRSNAKKSIKTHKQTLKTLKQQVAQDQLDEEQDEVEEQDDGNEEEEKQPEVKYFARPASETKEEKKLRKMQIKESQRDKRVENKKKELERKAKTIPGYKIKV